MELYNIYMYMLSYVAHVHMQMHIKKDSNALSENRQSNQYFLTFFSSKNSLNVSKLFKKKGLTHF